MKLIISTTQLYSYIHPGRHCCLWCLITLDQLILPPDVRGAVQFRTVQSICDDHRRFEQAGSVLKNVKHYNNCLNPPFFSNFPLSQVTSVCTVKSTTQIIILDPYRCALPGYTLPWVSSSAFLSCWRMIAICWTWPCMCKGVVVVPAMSYVAATDRAEG